MTYTTMGEVLWHSVGTELFVGEKSFDLALIDGRRGQLVLLHVFISNGA